MRVSLKFETKILHSDFCAQVNFISEAPTLQNLRIGFKKRQSGKSKVPAKQRGSGPKNVFKLKEHKRATFFSSPENRCLPASTLKPVEREFVVDNGASMHMISKKDLSKAEMDILTKSCSPTIDNRQWRSADTWRCNGECQRITVGCSRAPNGTERCVGVFRNGVNSVVESGWCFLVNHWIAVI